ncbi:putative separin [Leptomonas seymouri]|uniref:separase n=1 Tax=Leptomonas seymouri TaxID=5684 RepID=A0A0N1PCC3_LEPSE|nr:putative separin [Leptomonas seymouri]|eukprot:KPI83470.1 putative separin [Leptomonas seymouri]
MTASYRTRLTALQHGIHHVLQTPAEVEEVVSSAEQLAALHYKRFTSPWDIPKLLCAVLRQQLNARTACTGSDQRLPLQCLMRLFLVSWKMTPLVSLPQPTSTTQASSSSPAASSAVCSADSIVRISQKDIERVAAELDSLRGLRAAGCSPPSSFSASSALKESADVYRTALSIVMSLLVYLHVIAAEGGDDSFQRVSETLWHCAHRWAASGSSTGVRVMALKAWMNTVLRRALRSEDADALVRTIELLGGVLPSATPCPTPQIAAADSPVSSGLDECWARLHARVFQHVCVGLHKSQARLKDRWTQTVTPVLTRIAAHEPPLHSRAFFQAPHLGDAQESALKVLMDEVRRLDGTTSEETPSWEAAAQLLLHLLQLATLQRHVDATCLRITPFISAQTYETYVRPVVAVCLRWGLTDAALALLEWALDGLDSHGKEWLQRLRGLNAEGDRAVEERAAKPLYRADGAQTDERSSSFGGCLYTEWMAQQSSSFREWPATVPHALNILVSCGDNSTNVNQLRLVCDALLRCPAPWSTRVLTDPFAATFLLRSLARLAAYFLDVGDLPLARHYLALLCQLLPRHLCPPLLSVLMSLLQRFACALSAYHVSPLGYAVPSSAHGEAVLAWRRVKTHLGDAALPSFHERALISPKGAVASMYATGMAWRARQEFQKHCAAMHAKTSVSKTVAPAEGRSDSRPHLRCTAVEVQYTPEHGGTLTLRRTQLDVHRSAPYAPCVESRVAPCYTVRCNGVGEDLRACATEMTDILRCNREQLLRGSSGAAVEERPLYVDRRGGAQRSSSASPTELAAGVGVPIDPSEAVPVAKGTVSVLSAEAQHQRKKEWWHARYALDARIGTVVLSLQKALGAIRVLLAGRPSDVLSSRLATLAKDFALRCVQLRSSQPCASLDALQQATFLVLLGGPYLWSTSQGDSDAQPTSFYCPSPHRTCPVCAATLRTARTTLLEAIVETGQRAATYEDRSHAPLTLGSGGDGEGDDGWVSLLADAPLNTQVDALAAAALDAYYDECALYRAGSAEASTHPHLDLLLHPREHTYLVLGGELHGLPWEGLDVCCDRSTSRVPSLDYLQCAYQTLCGAAVSLRRVLLYRDCEALQGHSDLTDLITRHPTWEVHYGDTLCSAATAQSKGGPSSSSSSPLLRRVVGPPTDLDHLDTYVYAGHRGGEQLISCASLYEWLPRSLCTQPSLVLLMGCSSARMFGNAQYDSVGLPYAYLSAGCSCVVGCLWDVTDGDVDRLTCRLLDVATTVPPKSATVGESLAVAHRACKLRCLTALSAVLYGLNLPIERELRSGCGAAGNE